MKLTIKYIVLSTIYLYGTFTIIQKQKSIEVEI